MNLFFKQFSALNKSYFLLLFFVFSFSVAFAQPNATSTSCGTLTGQSLTTNGYSGSNATSTSGSCGQCCYSGSDLDNDGDADVNFSVENSKWYKYCNPSSSTSYTMSFVVDETNNDCNLQGAVFVTSGTSISGSTDAVDIDCSNQEYQQFGSGVSGNADGFSFTGVVIPAGGCAWLMVDGYGGATCGAYAVQTICPPACTIPTLATVGADKLICEGSSVALTTTVSGGVTTTPGPTYSWSPSTGLSCATCQNPTANPTSSSSYTFTVCNGGPGFCCRTDQINVNVTPNFVANAGSDIVSCSPSSVTIGGTTANPTGPSGSTYTWVVSGTNNAGISITSGANTANPVVTINAGLANGSTETYSVTVVNGACTRSDLVTVTVGNLAVNASSDQTVCAGSNIILGGSPTAPAGSTYSWTCSGTACANLAVSSSTVANPVITASSTASGTATYTVTANLSGCINTDVVVVTVNTLPLTPTASAAPSPVCAGQSVTLTASGGAGTGTYSWWSASTSGTNLGVANTLTVSPTITTTYYIQSTNATTGCTSLRGSVTASVNLTPVANAGLDKTLCVGQITTLAGTISNSATCSPAQTWSVITGSGSFSPDANTLNATFTPASSGSIQIRLIPCTTGGCTPVTDDIIFTVAPSPSVTISSTGNPLCQGLISDLSGIVTGGTTFPPTIVTQTFTSASGPFSIPDVNASGVAIPISVSGVSSPTIGSTTIASVTVNVDHDRIGQIDVWLCPPGSTPLTGCVQLFDNWGGSGDDLVNTVFTDGSPTDIASGIPPYTGSYNLTGSNTLSSLSGSPTNGTWSLIVIDNVNSPATTGTAGQWSINFSTPVAVNPYTYSWSPASALSSTNEVTTSFFSSGFTAPTSITHTLTVTDANGCIAKGVITTTIIGTPTLSAGTSQTVCSTSASLSTNSLITSESGLWSIVSGTGVFSSTTTNTTSISGLSTGDNFFKWKVTNTCGSDSSQFKITVTSSVTPTFSAVAAICSGKSFSLATSSTNSVAITGSWSPAINNTVTTQYTFTPTSGQCALTTVMTVTINPIPTLTITATNSLICSGNSTTLTAAGGSTYTWTPASTLSPSTGSLVTSTPTANVTYTISSTSVDGCTNTAVKSISINPTPTVAITSSPTSSICLGSVISFTAATANTYTWSGPAGNGLSGMSGTIVAATPSVSGSLTYTVNASSVAGCTTTAVKTITVVPNPTIAVNNATICNGASAILTASNAVTYLWNPGGAATASISVTPTITSFYSVTGSTAGCSDIKTATVTVNSIPTTSAITNGTISCTTPTISLTSTLSGMNYTWTAPAGGSVTTANTQNTSAFGGPGTYSLVVQSATGCTYSTTTSVTQNTTAPTGVNAGSNQTLTCGSPSVTLSGSVATPTNATVLWTGASVCGTATNLITSACGAGVYTLTATHPINGCISTSTVLVSPSAGAPSVTPIPVTSTITCTNTLVTVSISSTVSPATYTWSGTGIVSGNGTGTITVNQGGTFNYTLTNTTNSCTTSNNQVVVQNTAVPTTAASTTGTLTCIPTSTVALSASLAGLNYTWTAPSGGNVGTPTTQSTTASGITGTYSLTVKDPSNGCTFSTTTTVTQNTIVPTTTASTTGILTCANPSVTLNSILAGMNYTWTAPSGGSLTSVNSQSTMASGISGTYSLMVSNPATGCTYSTTTSVTQNTAAPTTIASTTGTLTCNTATVSLNSTLAGMNYTWTAPASGSVTSVNAQSTIASSVSGTYSLTVSNPTTGCIYSTTTSVTQNTTAPIGINAGSNQTLTCGSPSVTLTGSVATPTNATFVWTGANVCGITTNSITSACAGGIYTLTATDPINGCISTSTVQVFPNAGAPIVTNNPVTNTITCTNTLVTVSISSTVSPATYTWSGTGIVSGNGTGTITVNQGGTFNYTVTNTTNSCSASGNQVVIQNTVAPTGVSAGSNQTLTCGSPSVTLTGSVATPIDATFLWTGANVCGNPTNPVTSSCGAGAYTLTATNPLNGCALSSTVQVLPSAGAPSVTPIPVTSTITCTNTFVTVSISSTVSPATYTWSGTGIVSGNGTATITVNQGGTFNYTVTNTTNSCTTSNNQFVFQNTTVPTTTASTAEILTCATPTIDLNSTLTGMNYTWTAPSGGNVGTPTTQSTTASGIGGTYSLTVKDPSNGCTFSTTTTVTQNTIVPTTVASTTGTITCNAPSVNLSSTLAGMNYTWTAPASGSVSSANSQSTTASGINGTYSLSVLNPVTGCTYSTTTSVVQNTTAPTTSASTNGTLTCSTLTVSLTSTLAGMNYTWTAPAGGTFMSGINSQSVIASGAGGDYTLSVKDPVNGCVFSTTTSVTQNTVAPTGVSAGSNQTLTCLAPTATLTASGSGTYNWSGPGIVSGTNTANPVVNLQGIYTVTVTDLGNGCTSTATTTVIKDAPTPTITITGTPTLTCLSSTVSLNASGGGTYLWSGPGITGGSSTSTPSVNLPGVYSLTVTGTNGCTSSTTTAVSQNMSVTPLAISPDVTIHPGDSTSLSITGGSSSYTWSPALGLSCITCSSPIAKPAETIQYCVDSPEGICSNSKCVNVKVEINCENGSDYTTPNAFSPNGDGRNDEFCLKGWNCISSFYVAIYNRWGNRVFESTQEDFCWDGTYLGKLLDPAVFVFYIKAELVKGDKIDRKGNITLIK